MCSAGLLGGAAATTTATTRTAASGSTRLQLPRSHLLQHVLRMGKSATKSKSAVDRAGVLAAGKLPADGHVGCKLPAVGPCAAE